MVETSDCWLKERDDDDDGSNRSWVGGCPNHRGESPLNAVGPGCIEQKACLELGPIYIWTYFFVSINTKYSPFLDGLE